MSISVNLAKTYISNWMHYEEFFSPATLSQVLSHEQLSHFTTKIDVPVESNTNFYYEKQGYIKETEAHFATVLEYSNHHGGGWSRRVTKKCYTWLIPSATQHHEKELLREALCLEFPFLLEFSFFIYHFDQSATEKAVMQVRKENHSSSFYGEELYLYTDNGGDALYVPLLALKKKDKEMIINRHTRYYKEYYGVSKQNQKYLKHALSIVESYTAKKFFAALEA